MKSALNPMVRSAFGGTERSFEMGLYQVKCTVCGNTMYIPIDDGNAERFHFCCAWCEEYFVRTGGVLR